MCQPGADFMRIALYARISTNGNRQDSENQLTPLRQWAERLGGEVIAEYVDEASGSKSAKDRQALAGLLDGAHKRQFDTVLVWALDRLSREGIARLSGYLETFRRFGVRVLSHQEPWLDTAGPVSDLLVSIFGWIAAQELARIRERVKAGLVTAKAKGKKLGRPQRAFDVGKAQILIASGRSVREVAQIVGAPRATVARAVAKLTVMSERLQA